MVLECELHLSPCRWDQYITSDSGDEADVEEQFSVAFAAEAVAILAIGCVAGLKGLQKVRKGVSQSLGLHNYRNKVLMGVPPYLSLQGLFSQGGGKTEHRESFFFGGGGGGGGGD